jgi:hypothetical protein
MSYMSLVTYPTPSSPTSKNMRSQRKKRPLPLHVTQRRIEAERVNLVLRANNKLASLALNAAATQNRIFPVGQALILAA